MVVFDFSFVLKLFPRKDLAAIAALIFLISFLPFCWPVFEWWDMTPLALFLPHFTVLICLSISFLIFVMMFKKKEKKKQNPLPRILWWHHMGRKMSGGSCHSVCTMLGSQPFSEFIAYMTSKYLFLKWVYKLLRLIKRLLKKVTFSKHMQNGSWF